MHRHGLDVTTMRYDAHIKRAYDFPLSQPEIPSGTYVLPPSEEIKGASITFPDGVIVDIRQTSPFYPAFVPNSPLTLVFILLY